jgi:hypothetical protein
MSCETRGDILEEAGGKIKGAGHLNLYAEESKSPAEN